MDYNVFNEYEYKMIKIFFRFLKENGHFTYKKYIEEAFLSKYNEYLKSYTTKEGFVYGFFLWFSEEEMKQYHNNPLRDFSVENKKLSYKEFIARKLKYASPPLWFFTLINKRNAWFYDDKGKLTKNVDWNFLESLWFLYIVEDKNNEFDDTIKLVAETILKERRLI